jgi:hypothetical protein
MLKLTTILKTEGLLMGHHLGIRKGHANFHLHLTIKGYPLMCRLVVTFINIRQNFQTTYPFHTK